MFSKMQVYYHFLFFVSILNPCDVITQSMKNDEKNNISNNKGKWHVGRVSRKQYEIINMLWRKTKIFIDTETTKTLNNSLNEVNKHKRYKNSQHVTLVNHNPIQESFQLIHPKSKVYSSTSSYIEFYYLDELDERRKHNDITVRNNKAVTKSEVYGKVWNVELSRSPFFLFRVNEATCKATTADFFSHKLVRWSTSKTPKRAGHQKKTGKLKSNRRNKIHETAKSIRISKAKGKISSTLSVPTSKLKRVPFKQEIFKSSDKGFRDSINEYTSGPKTTTAVNDHIRFFDIYDSYVNTPHTIAEDEEANVNSNTIRNEKKINLNQVDHNAKHDDNKTRYVKKHVSQNKDHLKGNYEFYNLATTNINISPNNTTAKDNQSNLALWSDFPFIAVYVYEPTQVRCDGASISPHWLVTSASCLNRHHRDIKPEGRSAFVAYCSDNWQHPGRIAYVKQSLIHPRFHPKENSRRQLYNIGAIQVVNSMADTCNGWAPISLMSHQFTAASDGTLSMALGWGLDRYDTTFSLTELPKHLTLFKGLVYSDSCPGNTGYSNARREDEGSVKNVYCLSLPPYTDEENDPVHGGILLIGGKLIALYMQEERHRRGQQSAQYTGIWHLIPWLLDVAREPDELDPFSLEM